MGSAPSFHTEVTPIVLCTAQSSTSACCLCYREINTITPLSLHVLLVLVSPRDRSTSKNDTITPPPSALFCTWRRDLFRAEAAATLVWLLTSRAPAGAHVRGSMGNTSITEGKTALAVGSTSIARGKTTVSLGKSSIFRGVTTTSMGDSTIQRQKTTVALGRASFSRGTTTTSFRKALMPKRRNT